MTDFSSTHTAPHTDAEYQAALGAYVTDTQHLLDEMQAEQMEMDRLKENGWKVRAEIELLRRQTNDILSRLEAVVQTLWKDIVDIGKQVFALARELRQNKADLKETRERQNKQDEEIKELRQELRRMAEVLQRVAYETQRRNDQTDMQREMLLKDVEIMILRNMRGLPPPDKREEDKSE